MVAQFKASVDAASSDRVVQGGGWGDRDFCRRAAVRTFRARASGNRDFYRRTAARPYGSNG
jgi:hypothetical protein